MTSNKSAARADTSRPRGLKWTAMIAMLLFGARCVAPALAGGVGGSPQTGSLRAQAADPAAAASRGGGLIAPTTNVTPAPPAIATTMPAVLPVPDAASRQRAAKLVQDVFGADLARARHPSERLALAGRLLHAGIDEHGDAAARYVLFSLALENAEAAGNASAAFQAADALAGTFAVDCFRLKAAAAVAAARAASSPQDRLELVSTLGPFIDRCLVEDRYDIARQMAELALANAKAADPAIARQATARLQEVRDAQTAHAEAAAAADVLRRKPTDPEASLTLGRFRCFAKDDWPHGLPMLAAGSNATLKRLALQELAGPASADGQVALGDGWWDEAERLSFAGPSKLAVQRHAVAWYGRALAALDKGLLRDKLELRVRSVAPPPTSVAGASSPATELPPPSPAQTAPAGSAALAKLTPEQRAVAAGLRFGRFAVPTDREWTYTKADLYVDNGSPTGQVTEKARARVRLLCVNADRKPIVLEYWSDLKIAQRGGQWLHLSGIENATIKFNNRNDWVPVNAHVLVYFDEVPLYEQVWKPGDAKRWWEDDGPVAPAGGSSRAAPEGVDGAGGVLPAAGPGATAAKEQWISQRARYVVSSIEGEFAPRACLLTGEDKLYGGGPHGNFAFHTTNEAGAHIAIDLGRQRLVTRVFIQNRLDGFYDRARGLTIWLSSSPYQRGVKVWSADTPEASWDVKITPTEARYVVIGVPEDVTSTLHLAYVRVYGE